MRVAFNAHLLSYRHWYRSAGISRYIDRTMTHLAPYLRDDGCQAFVGPDAPAESSALNWLPLVRTPLPTHRPLARIIWEQVIAPVALRQTRAELLHCPAYVAPFGCPCPSVVTFHDLSFFVTPEAFNRTNRLYLQTFSRLTARRATRFIAVSEATRQDMVRLLGIAPERIVVAHNAADGEFAPIGDPNRLAEFRRAQGVPERFILYLGTLEPRKNVPALIRAYALARQRGVSEPLILAGGRGWGESSLAALVQELGLTNSVRHVGFVGMTDRVLWYNAATLFAYPSRYEGFGMPPLEAMACGTAVVSSNRSSLPEAVGDAGWLVDPDDPAALAEALVHLLSDDELRRDYAARGLARAGRFSWDASARVTIAAFQSALGRA
ncbi:MAG TPA: glycosyltransferase family 1 protein [Chloroflexota bacterium]